MTCLVFEAPQSSNQKRLMYRGVPEVAGFMKTTLLLLTTTASTLAWTDLLAAQTAKTFPRDMVTSPHVLKQGSWFAVQMRPLISSHESSRLYVLRGGGIRVTILTNLRPIAWSNNTHPGVA